SDTAARSFRSLRSLSTRTSSRSARSASTVSGFAAGATCFFARASSRGAAACFIGREGSATALSSNFSAAAGGAAGTATRCAGRVASMSGDSTPGFSCCMRSVTPKASTSTAAIETGAAQRRDAEGLASALRDAARIAASRDADGSSRASERYAALTLPSLSLTDRLLQLVHRVAQPALRRLLVGARGRRDLGGGEISLLVHQERLALREGKRRERLRQPVRDARSLQVRQR